MGLCLLKGYVDTWLMSLAPTIGESVCSWKSKTSVRKKSYWGHTLFKKKPCVQGKISDMWKHKTSLRKRILCLAMLAEINPFVGGEKL